MKYEDTQKDLGDMINKHSTDIGEIRKDIKSNRGNIEDLTVKFMDIDVKVGKNYSNIQNVQDNSHKKFEVVETKLKSLDDRNRIHTDNIGSIQETIIIHSEKINEVKELNDMARKQGETKAKKELEKVIENNAQTIDELKKGFEENINNIMSANITINENFNSLHIKSEETWRTLEDIRKEHNESVIILTKNINSEKGRIDNIEEEIKELDDTITQITTDVEKNTSSLHDLENAKVLDRADIDKTSNLIQEIDSKLNGLDNASSDRLKKAEENIRSNEEKN